MFKKLNVNAKIKERNQQYDFNKKQESHSNRDSNYNEETIEEIMSRFNERNSRPRVKKRKSPYVPLRFTCASCLFFNDNREECRLHTIPTKATSNVCSQYDPGN